MAGNLRQAFDDSVEANRHLVAGLDSAIVESGRAIADRVDDALEQGEGQEVTKALYLIPHMMNVLREMYATPKARRDAGIEEEVTRGKLAQIRDLRGRPAPTKKRNTAAS
jgi:hypothetical protein